MNKIVQHLNVVTGFIRAVAGDLPDPEYIDMGNYGGAQLRFGSLDDLQQWAAYLDITIEPRPGPVEIGQGDITYHEASAVLLEGDPVRLFFMEYAEALV